MTPAPLLRAVLSAIALVATGIVGGKMFLSDAPLEFPAPAVQFPDDPAMPGWKSIWEEPDPTHPDTHRYRRTTSEPPVSLEAQFIPDLMVHYVRNPEIELRFLPRGHLPLDSGMQFYVSGRAKVLANGHRGTINESHVEPGPAGTGFWTTDEGLHLSTLVSASGDNAIAPQKVAHQMYIDHLTTGRVIRWLLARENLPDRRCVLIHLSVATTQPATEADHRLLATAWEEWRAKNSPVFPVR